MLDSRLAHQGESSELQYSHIKNILKNAPGPPSLHSLGKSQHFLTKMAGYEKMNVRFEFPIIENPKSHVY